MPSVFLALLFEVVDDQRTIARGALFYPWLMVTCNTGNMPRFIRK